MLPKKPNLFKTISQKQHTGETKNPFCYAVILPDRPMNLGKGDAEKLFFGANDHLSVIAECKVSSSESEARLKALEQIKMNLNKSYSYYKKLLLHPLDEKKENLDDLKNITQNDLAENAYWIFTMNGKPEEINAILAPAHIGYSAKGFGTRIISIENNQGNTSYLRHKEKEMNLNFLITTLNSFGEYKFVMSDEKNGVELRLPTNTKNRIEADNILTNIFSKLSDAGIQNPKSYFILVHNIHGDFLISIQKPSDLADELQSLPGYRPKY